MVDNQLRIVDEQTGEIVSEGMEFTKTGLALDPRLTYDQWENVGQQLNQIEGAIQWWIGDWLNFGEHKWGEMYAQAVDESQAKSWQSYKWVSKSVKSSSRLEQLSWSHHQEVASLERDEQEYWLERAEDEGLTRNDLRHAIKLKRFQDSVGELPEGVYRVIYADPPWMYATPQHSREEQKTTLDSHYPSMSLSEICTMGLPKIAEDAVLFLWATSPLLPQAFNVIESWGFEYKGAFIWDKIKHNVGHYNSVRHELLLIATRGSCLPDKKPDDEPMLIDSVQSIERGEHSKKPERFREIIDQMYPSGNRIELFAREAHGGWDVWGNEV